MFSNNTDAYNFILGNARRSKKENRIAIKKKVNKLRVNAPEVMLKITSFTKTKKQVVDHLSYIARNGNVPIFDSYDRDVSEERAAGDIARDIVEIKGRKTMDMVLSMPPGTPENAFVDATQEYLKKYFGNHDYFYSFHNDTDCYHAHVVVPMVDRNLNRINPRKADIERWREGFAEELEIKGIPANAMKSIAKGKYKNNIPNSKFRTKGTNEDKRAVSEPLKRKVISAWRYIYKDMTDNNERETAESINQFMKDEFKTSFMVRGQDKIEDNELTR